MVGWFVIYANRLTDQRGDPNLEAQRIAKAQPNFLVTPTYGSYPRAHEFEPLNISPQLLQLMHRKNVKVYSFIFGQFSANPDRAYMSLEDTLAMVDRGFGAGVDGFMFGEVYNFMRPEIKDPSGIRRQYFIDCYNHIKNKKASSKVTFNVGSANVDEAIMPYCDVVSVENQWKVFPEKNAWMHGYPAERFGGTSKRLNWKGEVRYPIEINLESAIAETKEAWSKNIGYHYSAVSFHLELPEWFEQYAKALKKTGKAINALALAALALIVLSEQ